MQERDLLVTHLKKRAAEVRKEIINMIYLAQSGHPGGALSAADMVTALFFHKMRIDPTNPGWEDRDRFILSKGHACPVIYSALGLRGFFDQRAFKTLRAFGSILQGHPDMRKTPGLDATTGSLGQGLSLGVGMAIGAKFSDKEFYTYVLMGDGELNEGQVWEAALAARKYKLGNLVALVDQNGLQNDGRTADIMPMDSLEEKWRAFGWLTRSIDGHEMSQILSALQWASEDRDRPKVIIAHTIKGKGVSYMEDVVTWHSGAISDEQLRLALAEQEREWLDNA